jgi:hypothetical protein
VATLIGTLYVLYSDLFERFAYTLLVIAAFLNQTICLSVLRLNCGEVHSWARLGPIDVA